MPAVSELSTRHRFTIVSFFFFSLSRCPAVHASCVGALHSVGSVGLAFWNERQRDRVDAVPLVGLRVTEPLSSKYVAQVPVQTRIDA